MKLILASNSGFLQENGFALCGIPFSEMRVGYVTTASKGLDDISYLERHQKMMRNMGIFFEQYDIEGKNSTAMREFFADKNVVYITGGNTFYLLKAIRESGFDIVLRELIDRGVVYIGTSAGAYVMGPSIETATWKESNRERFSVTDFTGLGYVPFMLFAHYTSDIAERTAEKARTASHPARILKDGQGILVEGNTAIFVGEGTETIL